MKYQNQRGDYLQNWWNVVDWDRVEENYQQAQSRERTLGTFNESNRVHRIDKFVVPEPARGEFLGRVHETHELLRTLTGFLHDAVLEQTGGPGEFNFVTIAVWDSAESVESATEAVMARRKETGFDPQEMLARLGIQADFADYRQIDA